MSNLRPSSEFDSNLPESLNAIRVAFNSLIPPLASLLTLPGSLQFQASEISQDAVLLERSVPAIEERPWMADYLTGGFWRFDVSPSARRQIQQYSRSASSRLSIDFQAKDEQANEWLRTDVIPALIYPSGAIRSFSGLIDSVRNLDQSQLIRVRVNDELALLDPDGCDETIPQQLTLVLWRSCYENAGHAA